MAEYPNQHPNWPDKSKFEPFVSKTKIGTDRNVKRCQCWKSDRSAQCGNVAAKSFNVCRMHGGHKGSGRPVVTGESSKYIPKIDAAIAQALEDPELTGLRKEIGAIVYRQDQVLDSIRAAEKASAEGQKVSTKPFWDLWDELAEKKTALTIAENKRQAQLASNLNARQANVLRALLIAVLTDVVRDESIPRSQIPKLVGLKLIQKMS